MSKESDKSTPVPTPHQKEHTRNQSTEVNLVKTKNEHGPNRYYHYCRSGNYCSLRRIH
ncbi:hypothetical protein LZ575_12795 [Antarcticibacterium sp. 1MA-6-2]|uniref:hypothetical protein n=1 Tax=Antarcticibacterium sp. 1MA-6-2 TaxID=2908210 RepID=UPI001F452C66|nr:hypothetical protein [Antarcticibacterium sp. 1MA-6-2]UJH89874.1 hypothetical protein LZ575_12795 [Antarcticibacterium sp. 1MA-6-2]